MRMTDEEDEILCSFKNVRMMIHYYLFIYLFILHTSHAAYKAMAVNTRNST